MVKLSLDMVAFTWSRKVDELWDSWGHIGKFSNIRRETITLFFIGSIYDFRYLDVKVMVFTYSP